MSLDHEKDELVDIRTVSVSKELPKEERIAEFVRQIKTPTVSGAGTSPFAPALPRMA